VDLELFPYRIFAAESISDRIGCHFAMLWQEYNGILQNVI